MANESRDPSAMMEEKKTEVSINKDDVVNTREFFKHFNIPMPDMLKQTLDILESREVITIDDQELLKAVLGYAMNNIDHPLIKDEIFAEVHERGQKAWFEAQFKQDIEKVLSEAQTKKDNA